jgi:hypothetical protein
MVRGSLVRPNRKVYSVVVAGPSARLWLSAIALSAAVGAVPLEGAETDAIAPPGGAELEQLGQLRPGGDVEAAGRQRRVVGEGVGAVRGRGLGGA